MQADIDHEIGIMFENLSMSMVIGLIQGMTIYDDEVEIH